MISIDTSSITAEMRDRPDFIWHVQNHSARFNSEQFDRKQRSIICLHEATHVIYCRELGFDPKVFGPRIIYDHFSECFRRLDSAVEQVPYEIRMSADPMLVAKQYFGPVYTEERLIDHRTMQEIRADAQGDLKNLNKWTCERQKLKGDVKPNVGGLEAIRESVFKDCRSPKFRKKLWDAAHEFEARVFGEN